VGEFADEIFGDESTGCDLMGRGPRRGRLKSALRGACDQFGVVEDDDDFRNRSAAWKLSRIRGQTVVDEGG
jgi:hypothetical protein